MTAPGRGAVPIAVFDIDRTLILGTSAEELLARALRREGFLPARKVFSSLWQMSLRMHRGWHAAVHFKSYYLKGISLKTVEEILPRVLEEALFPRLSPRLMAFWPHLRQAGYRIYLVSGTLGPIVDRLVSELRADGGMGSTLETAADGRFTGRIIDMHPYHHGKPHALDLLLKDVDVDWAASFAFGDSWADVPLLGRFGHPVAMNPGFFMRIRARRRGWLTLRDKMGAPGPLQIDSLRRALAEIQSQRG